MAPKDTRNYDFGDFSFDDERTCLLRNGKVVPLTGIPFRLLLILLENRGRAVSHRTIVKALYGVTLRVSKCIDAPEIHRYQVHKQALCKIIGTHWIRADHGNGYIFLPETKLPSKDVDDRGIDSNFLSGPDYALASDLPERTYFKYRDESVEVLDTPDISWALAARYKCKPVSIGDQVYPVTILWQNKNRLIKPDTILGSLDYSKPEYFTSSPTLSVAEYAAAREFIESIYTKGPVQHEGLEYCMTGIFDITGSLPRIDGRFGWYYDNILTQYAMEWELKKALKEHGHLALAPNQVGILPLREAIEVGRNPLLDGTQRCTAMTVSMLMVFERREQGLWTIIHRRSGSVGLSAGMLHVVPAGMFEAKNRNERWSVKTAVMREMLEEVYNEEEQQGEEPIGFEDDIVNKKPLRFLFPLLENGRAELTVTGICCDLLNLRPEICTVLFVPDPGLAEVQKVRVNWEYEQRGESGTFGTRWDRIEAKLQNAKVGDIVPSGVACFELGRTWMRERHGV